MSSPVAVKLISKAINAGTNTDRLIRMTAGKRNAQAERKSAKVSPIILATCDGELSARTLV